MPNFLGKFAEDITGRTSVKRREAGKRPVPKKGDAPATTNAARTQAAARDYQKTAQPRRSDPEFLRAVEEAKRRQAANSPQR